MHIIGKDTVLGNSSGHTMPVSRRRRLILGYILIETEIDHTQSVGKAVKELTRAHETEVVRADTVTGPYDVIAQLRGNNLECLGKFITEEIKKVPGVKRTTTCLTVNLG